MNFMKIKSSLKLNSFHKQSIRKNLFQIRSTIFQRSDQNGNKNNNQLKLVEKLTLEDSTNLNTSRNFTKYFSPISTKRKHTNFRLSLKKKQTQISNELKNNNSFSEQKQDQLPTNRKRRVTQGSAPKQLQIKQCQLSGNKHATLVQSMVSLNKKQINRTVNYNKFISIKNTNSSDNFLSSIQEQEKIMKFIKILGTGTYAQVRLAKSQNNKYAIKIYDKFKIFSKTKKDRIYQQIRILNKISRHNNIINLIQAYQNKNQIHLLFQYIQGGISLQKYFIDKNLYLNQKQIKKIFVKIVKGVNHLHNLGIVHRDIKPANIIIGFDQDSQTIVKIIDFGLATDRPQNQYYCGTPNFMAPQLILRNKHINLMGCDVWALGIMLFYLSQGCFPFIGNNQIQLYSCILKGKFTFIRTFSNKLQNLIKKILNPDPHYRISAQQILKDQFFY